MRPIVYEVCHYNFILFFLLKGDYSISIIKLKGTGYPITITTATKNKKIQIKQANSTIFLLKKKKLNYLVF